MIDATIVKAQAYGLGFDIVGIASLGPAESAPHFNEWLANGYAGEMAYLERGSVKRQNSGSPFPGTTSAVVVAMNYGGREPSGPIARYARGDDYHNVMEDRLDALHAWISEVEGRRVPGKAYVDTGPLLERDLAQRAGIGWVGKNTNLINPGLGSFFFIGALLLDLELNADPPFGADRCGTCSRCLDACPTDAFVAPRILDARRCISYLTIEQKGVIPEEFRESVGELVYGCDICQDVCPWNHKFSRELVEPALKHTEALRNPDLRKMIALDDDEFRTVFRRSPIKRTKRRGLARNVAVAMGNSGDASYLPALRSRQTAENDAMVAEHIDWAIQRLESATGTDQAAPRVEISITNR